MPEQQLVFSVFRSIKIHYLFSLIAITCCQVSFAGSGVDPDEVTIVRDRWGVPHIHAPTDAGAAYGLAWATAEDDFESIQFNLLGVNGYLGSQIGKDGAIIDFAAFLFDLDALVDSLYEVSFSEKFKQILEAYSEAVNVYAEQHPKEVMLKKLFPVGPKDIVKGYVLAMAFLTHVPDDLGRIFKRQMKDYENQLPKGSNAMAVSKSKTKDGKTYLAVNSHQPLEGPLAWYEAHLVSDEGMNMLGATFPGGVCMFVGSNEHLGWAHTLNYPDLCDVYKLTTDKKQKGKYLFDGEWLPLEERSKKVKVKLGFLKLPIKKTFYTSKYGPTIKTKDGYYALRIPALMGINTSEQWYHMNKASNFNEFEKALKMQAMPGMNLVYADDQDNILYYGAGHFPERDPNYDWQAVLPGDTSATWWRARFHPYEAQVQVKNPECGYVYNTNNTPFSSTCTHENPNPDDFPVEFGYRKKDNNRALRFQHLIDQYDKLDWADFKRVKNDVGVMDPLYTLTIENVDEIFKLSGKDYPKIAESLDFLRQWNRLGTAENEQASMVSLIFQYLVKHLSKLGRLDKVNTVEEEVLVESVKFAQKHLKKHFGSIHVPLGELQRHVRGKVDYPIWGLPDVLAAMHCQPYKKGRLKAVAGESYIQMVRFSSEGTEIESVNAYGTSAHEESKHYTDQMGLYVNQQLKKMSLEWEDVLDQAERIYHPGK